MFARIEAELATVQNRLAQKPGFYAESACTRQARYISAFIRDGLVCKFGFYPRLYGI